MYLDCIKEEKKIKVFSYAAKCEIPAASFKLGSKNI